MTDRYFIIGDPVSHSLSPCIHSKLFEIFGIDARYDPLRVRRGDVDGFIRYARDVYAGGNVTVPHKEEAVRGVDRLSEEARFIGAINTVKVEDGQVTGFNTDCWGFVASVKEEVGHFLFKEAFIFGAGGAARGIVFGIVSEGVRKVTLWNRTAERAVRLARELEEKFPHVHVERTGLTGDEMESLVSSADLVINATSLGLKEDFLGFPFDAVKKGALVVDIVYGKEGTYLVREGRKRGVDCLDGLGMLAGQAAYAFEIWTGIQPPYREVKRITERCLHGK